MLPITCFAHYLDARRTDIKWSTECRARMHEQAAMARFRKDAGKEGSLSLGKKSVTTAAA